MTIITILKYFHKPKKIDSYNEVDINSMILIR